MKLDFQRLGCAVVEYTTENDFDDAARIVNKSKIADSTIWACRTLGIVHSRYRLAASQVSKPRVCENRQCYIT